MKKARSKGSQDRLPDNHPVLAPVKPEHLAFAFNCAYGVAAGRMLGPNPSDYGVDMEEADGQIQSYALADNPFSRVMTCVLKELRSFFPGESANDFQQRAAITFRLIAMVDLLQSPEFEQLVQRDPEGNFSLPPYATIACAKAPLSTETTRIDRSKFPEILHIVRTESVDGDSELFLRWHA